MMTKTYKYTGSFEQEILGIGKVKPGQIVKLHKEINRSDFQEVKEVKVEKKAEVKVEKKTEEKENS